MTGWITSVFEPVAAALVGVVASSIGHLPLALLTCATVAAAVRFPTRD
ncbi:hypothetical protein AB0425_17300 [Actinosynnema sp. NPDC051121]